jgi:hypothetical protein
VTLKTALFNYLSGKTSITGALGSPPAVYPDFAPQGAALPYVVYQRINSGHEHHMQGASGLGDCLMQFDVYAADSVVRSTVSEALRNVLDGLIQSRIGTSPNQCDVRSCSLQNEQESEEAPTKDDEGVKFRNRMDFKIFYKESIPSFT